VEIEHAQTPALPQAVQRTHRRAPKAEHLESREILERPQVSGRLVVEVGRGQPQSA
jgi:hypothetical protein